MSLARPRNGVRLRPGTDLLSKGLQDNYEEDQEQKLERMRFELSHSFKDGDEVMVVGITTLPQVYVGMIGKVVRTKTYPGTGPCISAKIGGNTINFHKPNEELIAFRSNIMRYLYK